MSIKTMDKILTRLFLIFNFGCSAAIAGYTNIWYGLSFFAFLPIIAISLLYILERIELNMRKKRL